MGAQLASFKLDTKDVKLCTLLVRVLFLFLFCSVLLNTVVGVPFVAQRLTNPASIFEDVGLIPCLAQ